MPVDPEAEAPMNTPPPEIGATLGFPCNPLLLLGPSGSGKTHHLRRIADEALQRDPELRVARMTTESLLTCCVEAIRSERWVGFLDEFAGSFDLLLLDNTEVLEDKTGSTACILELVQHLMPDRRVVLACLSSSSVVPALVDQLASCSRGEVLSLEPPDDEALARHIRTVARLRGVELSHSDAASLAAKAETFWEARGLALRAVFESRREP